MIRTPALRLVLSLLIAAAFLAVGCQQSTSAVAAKKITKEEAEEALSPIVPDVKVISVEPSPVEGLWEVILESRGEKGIVYLDYAKKHLIAGQVLEVSSKANLTKQKFEQISRVEYEKIPLDDAMVMGNPKAKYKAVVFDDPD